jgi:DNA-binding IclR family transcriptional regulator
MAAKGNLVGLRRGFDVLRHLAANQEGIPFNRLADLTGLPAPTLSRILKVLVDEGMISKNGVYALGQEFIALARLATGAASRAELLQGLLENLGRATGESAAYYEFRGLDITCIAKAEQSESFHYMAIGNLNSRVLLNAFGQVCIAFLDADEQKQVLGKADPGPCIPRADFRVRLKQIHEECIFVENGEANPSLIRIVAPVFDGEALAGSLGITLLKRKLSKGVIENLKREVMAAAAEASRRMEGAP